MSEAEFNRQCDEIERTCDWIGRECRRPDLPDAAIAELIRRLAVTSRILARLAETRDPRWPSTSSTITS